VRPRSGARGEGQRSHDPAHLADVGFAIHPVRALIYRLGRGMRATRVVYLGRHVGTLLRRGDA